jgi:hypothetical protein
VDAESNKCGFLEEAYIRHFNLHMCEKFHWVGLQNMEVLQNAGVVQLLKPLLLDYVPVIQQTAVLGLCMLANYNEKLAESLVTEGILEQLVYSLK